jgi:dihydrofolate synthase/folylpolyglutamate synthase
MAVERCQQVGARLVMAGPELRVISREVAVGGQLVTLQTPGARYEDIPLALKGDYQADNAALALAAVEAFFGGKAIAGDVVEHALMSVSSPGRLEVVRTSPTVVVDAAHNPHGAEATVRALREYYPGRLVAVVAMMADKDVEGFLGEIEPVFSDVVVTGMPTDRAMAPEDLADIARDVFGEDRVHVNEDLEEAILQAADIAEAGDSEPMTYPAVIVLGSIQLAAAARTLMGKPAADGA